MNASLSASNSPAARRRGALDFVALFESVLKLAGCFLLATLIGLVVVFAFTRLDTTHPLTRQTRAEREILVLDRALRAWAAAHEGKYPSSLAELMEPGGTLELPRSILIDPWKRPYRFVPSADPDEPPTISSLGLDGKQGGDAESLDLDNSDLGEPDADAGLREALQLWKDLEGPLPAHAQTKARKTHAPEPPPAPIEPNRHP